jgi:hypothetical protein
MQGWKSGLIGFAGKPFAAVDPAGAFSQEATSLISPQR